ncbi:hydrogenase nickel incorporation protein HypB [Mesosutterella sp. OilRF-GAM-744-9]|uniref:Hydrogenase maturation factor HypB n=1 Tax=Mesosutterella porci TaxID=2915351 RepID=A0ABS9MS27_9BURK|nr:hydrogenase nickel incorporation protein HypB [Mesosutterella sp. oilRF-744-WT-GAM-9]MCG5031415.1 hydrogenase nickel incorporation protein HypB [Mesosutterella sp. oilRF-744-WT-GAM-9]MCI6530334.1 hydrogenase nickel incorporation protein HypB [Mesosutterella sp.]
MCTTCGCGGNHSHIHAHTDENSNVTIHAGEDGHDHDHHHHDEGSRTISVEEDILARNNADAAKNRAFFASRGILALNFVSSPGSGKTELLAATIRRADPKKLPITVIEGDQETNNDADRIRSAGARSVQINTGKGCHLDAAMVAHALEHLNPEPGSACLIENVGNLVCPAEFDLGEAHKVVVISVTEGADKPLKYPDMFRAADLMLINKIDLLPYVDFDIDKCEEYARRVNPKIRSMRVSATKGDGLERWIKWLEAELTLASL